ncbi:hypothetical protein MPTK1_5g03910 [Marchantia polymorpha subsp. ruderalis]|uniref:Uncharacterized protein n=2 Tax=Marchantia polymorpha TaxID=3197 RepID=A0AAF6BEQ1_MARPO|nr:hypothetical protein MARPO_0259s0003 [Marchantia polymorpha]BBN10485.1 hypothetical protein Mp_5g03910 [Marchantia polymorpha subsp. ruderalis]|eukprot:PTQ26947.1 hypothetical protein MARPO_0259s0003 [Marchantia polymorpha]
MRRRFKLIRCMLEKRTFCLFVFLHEASRPDETSVEHVRLYRTIRKLSRNGSELPVNGGLKGTSYYII